MNLGELAEKLNEFLKENPERKSLQVYFDTDARTFDYHLAKVGSVYVNEDTGLEDAAFVSLHED